PGLRERADAGAQVLEEPRRLVDVAELQGQAGLVNRVPHGVPAHRGRSAPVTFLEEFDRSVEVAVPLRQARQPFPVTGTSQGVEARLLREPLHAGEDAARALGIAMERSRSGAVVERTRGD